MFIAGKNKNIPSIKGIFLSENFISYVLRNYSLRDLNMDIYS